LGDLLDEGEENKAQEKNSPFSNILEAVTTHEGRETLFKSVGRFFSMLPPDIIANWIVGSNLVLKLKIYIEIFLL